MGVQNKRKCICSLQFEKFESNKIDGGNFKSERELILIKCSESITY